MTAEEIIEEIYKWPKEKRRVVDVYFEVYEANPETSEDEFVQILLERGVINDVSEYTT